MGSFSYTCAVSGLPIHAGDAVKYMLVCSSPYADERPSGINSAWFLRTFPVSASYNDYGSVEDIDPDSPVIKSWMDMFQLDLIERGWGDNSCHDIDTRKDMTFDHLLDALGEGRVQVSSDGSFASSSGAEDLYPDGVPTVRRIADLLKLRGQGEEA